jgi:drug/metabolite transporter (DMT)-like permease
MSETNGLRSTLARALIAQGDNPALAAGLMVSALALLSLQDAVIKLTSDWLSIWQFQTLRSLINLSLLLATAGFFSSWSQLRPRSLATVALRSLFLVGAMLCFFSGVPFLSLAEIAAGLYLFPLIVALLSRVVLGETVGPDRLGAVAAGFTGSMLILKPANEDFQMISLLPIAAAFFYACMVLTTRKLCRGESPLALASGVAVGFLAVGLIGLAIFPAASEASPDAQQWSYLMTGWHPLSFMLFAAIAACALLNLTASILLARSYQTAESSWLAPFDYSYLVFAALWGYALWGTIPDPLTLIGMALIAAAGIFVATRTQKSA